MSEFGNFSEPPELNTDIAAIQARQRGNTVDVQNAQLPATAFVAALNGQGGNITLAAGTVSAGAITFTNGVGTVSINLTGLGTLATKNIAGAVADLATVASAGYVQAEAQSVIDKLNALLGSLRTAGVIAP